MGARGRLASRKRRRATSDSATDRHTEVIELSSSLPQCRTVSPKHTSAQRERSSNSASPHGDETPRFGRSPALNNDDVCDVCRDGGNLVMCDSCEKSYHGACISPRCDPRTLPAVWACPACFQAAAASTLDASTAPVQPQQAVSDTSSLTSLSSPSSTPPNKRRGRVVRRLQARHRNSLHAAQPTTVEGINAPSLSRVDGGSLSPSRASDSPIIPMSSLREVLNSSYPPAASPRALTLSEKTENQPLEALLGGRRVDETAAHNVERVAGDEAFNARRAQELGLRLLEARDLERQLQKLNTERRRVEGGLEATEHKVLEKRQAYQDLSDRLKALQTELQEQEQGMKKSESHMAALQQQLQENAASIKALETQRKKVVHMLEVDISLTDVCFPQSSQAADAADVSSLHARNEGCAESNTGMDLEGLLRQLFSLGLIDVDVDDLLATVQISPLGQVSATVEQLWRDSTIRSPVLVPADGSFSADDPSTEMLWSAAFKNKGHKIFVHGEETAERAMESLAFYQLHHPNPASAISIIGIQPRLSPTLDFRVPGRLAHYVTAHAQQDTLYNLTPKYAYIDLHLDYGPDGVSRTLGKCEKYWLLYPPTKRNLGLIASVLGVKGRLSKLIGQLEAGIVARTRSSEALYVPAGCIHATYTSSGGFLVTKDFVTLDTFRPIASLIQSRFFDACEPETNQLCLQWFSTSLEIASNHGKQLEVLHAWMLVESKLKAYLPRCAPTLRQRVFSLFKDLFDKWDARGSRCPCGDQGQTETLCQHWLGKHLQHSKV